MAKSSGLRPMVSAKGITSQDNGAQELPGTYTTRPFPSYVGERNSVEINPRLGTPGGGNAHHSPLNGRQGKK